MFLSSFLFIAKKQKLCSVDNGGCLQQCIQHSKYCIFGKCFFSCSIDSLCTKWVECKCDPGYKLLKDKTNCAGNEGFGVQHRRIIMI